jgi:hypothetical protein
LNGEWEGGRRSQVVWSRSEFGGERARLVYDSAVETLRTVPRAIDCGYLVNNTVQSKKEITKLPEFCYYSPPEFARSHPLFLAVLPFHVCHSRFSAGPLTPS